MPAATDEVAAGFSYAENAPCGLCTARGLQLVREHACGGFFDEFCTVCPGVYGSPSGKQRLVSDWQISGCGPTTPPCFVDSLKAHTSVQKSHILHLRCSLCLLKSAAAQGLWALPTPGRGMIPLHPALCQQPESPLRFFYRKGLGYGMGITPSPASASRTPPPAPAC